MRIIKLDAIESTNDFLKSLAADQHVQNFTVVTAETQTRGKGQMGSTWTSEPGKNLTMSILLHDVVGDLSKIFVLNAAVAIAVCDVLEADGLEVQIKWPNDIMAGDKKIGGILIENSINGNLVRSVVGIGLNVNQTEFVDLPRASSLAILTGKQWDRDLLLEQILERIKATTANLQADQLKLLTAYNEKLFRRGVETAFRTAVGIFSGVILKVGIDGLLQVRHQNNQIKYDLKQLEMLY